MENILSMNIFQQLLKIRSICCSSSKLYSNASYSIPKSERSPVSSINKSLHCYRTLYPWDNADEFSKYLISCIVYNKDGLLVLNKPFGIKIHSHDKPGARPKSEHQFIKPSVPECAYTVEDFLPMLQEHFNLSSLSIIKSAEKYTSGIVLLSSSDAVTKRLQKSFNIAKFQKKPHLVHWAVTIGYPVVPFRKEKVGIKFVETEKDGLSQPVIQTEISKRACKRREIYSVLVESRTISINEELSTSLVEIASSSVRWHFVRVYCSTRVAPILGDIMYSSRMKKLFGVPVKVPLPTSDSEPLPAKMSEVLQLHKGTAGQLMVPTMLHLRSIILPDYQKKGEDYVITVDLPPHFQWTVNRLNLLIVNK